MAATLESDKAELLTRIRREYDEMPGLRLSRRQVARLLGMDDVTCERLLRALITSRFLSRTAGGLYARHVQSESCFGARISRLP